MTGLGRDPFDDLLGAPAGSPKPTRADAAERTTKITARRTFELPRELIEQLRDTVWALSGPPHRLTLNQLASDALARELDRLWNEHNGGVPFPPRGAELRPGRRVEP
jgi:hypothetical protein